MRLVAGVAARTQLLQGHHQLDGIEHPDDARELGGRQPARDAHERVARDVDVDEHAREPLVGERHRLLGDLQVDSVRDEEAVDHVEVRSVAAVEPHDAAVLDDELRLGVGRPVGGDEPELGPRLHEKLAPQLRRLACREARAPARVRHPP